MVAGFSSCKKWLDVKPKTQVESTENFKDEQGFKDALTGVYLNMVSPRLYGKELSFGMIEVLGKNYTQFTTSHPYFEDANYNYAFAATRSRIDGIWNTGYFTIANVNNLIENLEKADRGLFTENNYDVIKAEAYGLRAFNHFDLLRLFAPSPAASGGTAAAIPYRDKFEKGNVQQLTVNEVIFKIISDLKTAAALLKPTDPIVAGSPIPTTVTGYLRDRHFKLNYYAVIALMARVYLYSGDINNALICAKEVIDSGKFPATPLSQIATPGNPVGTGNRIFSTEVIFDLYINSLATLYDASFSSTISTGMLFSSSEWATVYETASIGSADYRWLYQVEVVGANRYSAKFKPLFNGAAANRLPLMRISEMYDIAAECLKNTDPQRAIAYLNTIRATRNLVSLPLNLSATEIQAEVFKEYRKDFITEGQLFFYYKRLNLTKIEFTQVAGSNAVYVLPKPDNEIEYGAIR
jgi:hypothetical protein